MGNSQLTGHHGRRKQSAGTGPKQNQEKLTDDDSTPPDKSAKVVTSFKRLQGSFRQKRSTNQKSDVTKKYHILYNQQLGHGHYGVVLKCTEIATGKPFAIKTIKKSRVNRLETLMREIEILSCVDHPSIIKLIDVYEDDQYIYLVQELCTGGELFDRIIKRTDKGEGGYTEKQAALIMRSILRGISYIHTHHNICHRDLKPENFLFKTADDESDIKIIDFGLSRFVDGNNTMNTRVGTPYYIAPEVLNRRYDKACDLWSLGVITYILLSGFPPFYGDNDQEIFNSVRKGQFDFPSPEWDRISLEARDFIRSLLKMNPSERLTAEQALEHAWIVGEGGTTPPQVPAPVEVAGEMVERINHRLRRFVGMGKLKKVALNVIAQHLTEAQIGHLRDVFQSLDADGNGSISVEELRNIVAQEGFQVLEEDVERLLHGIDIDGSNTLDYREFLAATMERSIFIREENMRRGFAYFDLDNTGQITMANLTKIFGSEQHAREIMGDVDINSDGFIEYSEFREMMLALEDVSSQSSNHRVTPPKAEEKENSKEGSANSTPRKSIKDMNAKDCDEPDSPRK